MSDPNSTHPDRRTFLQIAGALVGASVTGDRRARLAGDAAQPAGTLSAGFAAPPIPEVRIGFVGVGGQGGIARPQHARCAGRAHHRGLRHRRGPREAHAEIGRRGRAEGADRLRARPARLRAAVRNRGSRSRLQRHALGMARAGVRRRDEERQARRDRSAGGDDARRLLAARRARGEAPQALRDDGELQLRPSRDDGLQHGAAGPLRRDPARRGRLSARPARASSSPTGARDSGAGPGRRRSTRISIPRTALARSPTAWTSTAAIASSTSSR